MDSKRKIAAFFLYFLLVIAVAPVALRSRPVANAAFKGWTIDRGTRHAIIEFPPASNSRLTKTYFLRSFYCVQLDLSYILSDGHATNESLWLPVMGSPREHTTVKIPVPDRATHLKVTRARTSIERRWDNLPLPFRLHSTFFTFIPPQVDSLPGQNPLR